MRESVNKHFHTNISHSIPVHISKVLASKEMDINLNNNIRRRPTFLCKTSSRSSSISSMVSLILYYERMKINNNILDKDVVESVNSL